MDSKADRFSADVTPTNRERRSLGATGTRRSHHAMEEAVFNKKYIQVLSRYLLLFIHGVKQLSNCTREASIFASNV